MYTLTRKNKEPILIEDLNLYEYKGAEIKDKIELLPKLEFALLLAKSGLKATELVSLIHEKKEYYNLSKDELQKELDKLNIQIQNNTENKILENKKEEINIILDLKILENELEELQKDYKQIKANLPVKKQKEMQNKIENSEAILDLHRQELSKFYLTSKIAELNLDIQLVENEKTKEIKKDIIETKAELITLIKDEFNIQDRLTLSEQDELIDAIAKFNEIEKKISE